MGTSIEQELIQAGYKMLTHDASIEQLILKILREKNTRNLKAIPFLLYSYHVDIKKIYSLSTEKELFATILGFTKKIFEENKISTPLPHYEGNEKLDFNEFKEEFALQLLNQRPILANEQQKIYAERDFQMKLSLLFAKKEKEILLKILDSKTLTKTEYEYYSRKTKKKLKSIITLTDLAHALDMVSPKLEKISKNNI